MQVPQQMNFTEQLSRINFQDLKTLRQDVRNEIFTREYPEFKKYSKLVFQSYVDLVESNGVWMCYEAGQANRITYHVDGDELVVDIINHGSKHTNTQVFSISFDGQYWVHSDGDYKKPNTRTLSLAHICDIVGVDTRVPEDAYDLINALLCRKLSYQDALRKSVCDELEIDEVEWDSDEYDEKDDHKSE
jgi:hypothetical protein